MVLERVRTVPRLVLLVLLTCGACVAPDDEDVITRPRREPALTQTTQCVPSGAYRIELPVWDLSVSHARWDQLHEDIFADVTVDAVLCIGEDAYEIGLELQGSSTRRLKKKSFDLKARSSKGFRTDVFGEPERFPRLILKAMYQDQSLVREAVAFELWRKLGHEAPRIGFVNLRINGDYWGLYAVVEPVNGDYFARRADSYALGGTLYKGVRKHGSYADFAPKRDLRKAFEAKSHALLGSADYEDLEALVERLQQTPLDAAAYASEIDPIFPLAQYYDRMIWVALTQNGDGTQQNFFLYNTPHDEHDAWNIVPWDSNIAFGASWRAPYDRPSRLGAGLQIDGGNHFGKRLVRVDGVREAYIARFREVLDDVLPVAEVQRVVERYKRTVQRDLAVDQARWRRVVSPEEVFRAIDEFVDTRPSYLDEGLAELEASFAEPREETDDEEVDTDHLEDPRETDESSPSDAGIEGEEA